MWKKAQRAGVAVLVAVSGAACASPGVGDPCVPEDEYQKTFPGYALIQTAMEGQSVQCETRLCLVNHYQGRVSCPYGQSLAANPHARCRVPGVSGPAGEVTVDVRPADRHRLASDAVYCSCRCAGRDPSARYCTCPTGFSCDEIQRDIGVGGAELSGSYCVKNGTQFVRSQYVPGDTCDRAKQNCGSEDASR